MYWSRSGSYIDLLAWLILTGLWWAGGWLISSRLFQTRQRERFFTGMAVGLLLFITLSNLLAQILPGATLLRLDLAFWSAALIIFLAGLLVSWKARATFSFRSILDELSWKQIAIFLALLALFILINRGLAIFDENNNLPLVARLALGDLPPHYYLNPEQRLDYHYGLHLYAASLVRIGGFFPWSAFDLVRAQAIALTLMLAGLWLRRYIRTTWALALAGLLILFGGGARWLLLFLPESTLLEMSARISLQGSALTTGENLFTALTLPWKIEGGGPFPFPFAFVNGIFPPLSMALTGSGALPQLTLVLLLLLARRRWTITTGLAYGLLIASLALTGEHLLVMLFAGLLAATLIRLLPRQRREFNHRPVISQLSQVLWIIIPGLILALVGGGVLTETFRRFLSGLGGAPIETGLGFSSLGLRWPPALVSAHLGPMALTDGWQLLAALAEVGPALLLAPWLTWLALKGAVRGGRPDRGWIEAGAIYGAGIGFLAALVVSLATRDRDISRMTGAALFIWMLLSLPRLWLTFKQTTTRSPGRSPVYRAAWMRYVLIAGYIITIAAGFSLFPAQTIAIGKPQFTYFIEEPDVLLSKAYWDRLKPGAWVLDLAYPPRPATLFGRDIGRAFEDIYVPAPEFQSLLISPDPHRIAGAGYSYVYFDKKTWLNLLPEQKKAFQRACVKEIAEQRTELGDFRRLLDVQACLPDSAP
ncbi:MAG: hypothetical protein JXB15_00245 [Anaerolineales bacterium]|nr:hypothetical protein [Anaerolineales bacterium]